MKHFFLALFITAFMAPCQAQLAGKRVCIDPGHGGTAATDHYRVGPTGEREEWINLRVALLLRDKLEKAGVKVAMTRTDDRFVPLADRARLAREQQADLFVSIHHNATADSSVNFPIIYFHGNASENQAGVHLGKLLAEKLLTGLYQKRIGDAGQKASVVSDFTIFAEQGASVLRNTYGIPAVLAEASFFTNQEEEQKLRLPDHNEREAIAYVEAIIAFFGEEHPTILPYCSMIKPIPAFPVFQEAERMTPVAKRWKQDYLEGKSIIKTNPDQAYALLTRSARSFPDSDVAAECHRLRAELLQQAGKDTEARQEMQRFREYYVKLP